MLRRGRNIIPLVLSFAIGIVSTTCTSAGCLLASVAVEAPASDAGAAPERACCAHRHADSHSPAPAPSKSGDDQKCPLCRTTVLIGKPAEKSLSALDLTTATLLMLPVLHVSAAADLALAPTRSTDREPHCSAPPSTLLALHCALLN